MNSVSQRREVFILMHSLGMLIAGRGDDNGFPVWNLGKLILRALGLWEDKPSYSFIFNYFENSNKKIVLGVKHFVFHHTISSKVAIPMIDWQVAVVMRQDKHSGNYKTSIAAFHECSVLTIVKLLNAKSHENLFGSSRIVTSEQRRKCLYG